MTPTMLNLLLTTRAQPICDVATFRAATSTRYSTMFDGLPDPLISAHLLEASKTLARFEWVGHTIQTHSKVLGDMMYLRPVPDYFPPPSKVQVFSLEMPEIIGVEDYLSDSQGFDSLYPDELVLLTKTDDPQMSGIVAFLALVEDTLFFKTIKSDIAFPYPVEETLGKFEIVTDRSIGEDTEKFAQPFPFPRAGQPLLYSDQVTKWYEIHPAIEDAVILMTENSLMKFFKSQAQMDEIMLGGKDDSVKKVVLGDLEVELGTTNTKAVVSPYSQKFASNPQILALGDDVLSIIQHLLYVPPPPAPSRDTSRGVGVFRVLT
jgi:hypothetical protein